MPNQNYYKTRERIFKQDPEFPLRVTQELPQTVTVRHQHEVCECVFVHAGNGFHQSEDREPVPIRRGDVIVIPPGGRHAYTQASGDLNIVNLMFDTSHLPPILMELYSDPAYKQVFLRDPRSFDDQDFPMTRLDDEVFGELETMLLHLVRTGETAGDHCYKLGLFMAILSRLCQAWQIRPAEIPVPLDIPKLTAYLERNFQRPIYLDDLAKRAGMSRATLLRHFRSALGATPMIYLRNLRLRHAAELLLKTELNLKEVADRSGFQSVIYFARTFKLKFGTSPILFRKNRFRDS